MKYIVVAILFLTVSLDTILAQQALPDTSREFLVTNSGELIIDKDTIEWELKDSTQADYDYFIINDRRIPYHEVRLIQTEGQLFANMRKFLKKEENSFVPSSIRGKVNFFGDIDDDNGGYINKSTDSLLKATNKNMMLLMKDNPKAYKHLQKRKGFFITEYSAAAFGVAAIVTGFAVQLSTPPKQNPNGTYVVEASAIETGMKLGVPPLILQLVMYPFRPRRKKAVRIYNNIP